MMSPHKTLAIATLSWVGVSVMADSVPNTHLFDPSRLVEARSALLMDPPPSYANASSPLGRSLASLKSNANKVLEETTVWSVMNKTLSIPGVSPHNYISIGIYNHPCNALPDGCTPYPGTPPYPKPFPPSMCDNETGLPWYPCDGQTNPAAIDEGDSPRQGQMAEAVTNLALAAFFAENGTASAPLIARAKNIVDVWFLDNATAMLPNLYYGTPPHAQRSENEVPFQLSDFICVLVKIQAKFIQQRPHLLLDMVASLNGLTLRTWSTPSSCCGFRTQEMGEVEGRCCLSFFSLACCSLWWQNDHALHLRSDLCLWTDGTKASTKNCVTGGENLKDMLSHRPRQESVECRTIMDHGSCRRVLKVSRSEALTPLLFEGLTSIGKALPYMPVILQQRAYPRRKYARKELQSRLNPTARNGLNSSARCPVGTANTI